MEMLYYAIGLYILIGLFIGLMIRFKKSEPWGRAMLDGMTWIKLIPQMWA